MESPRGDIPSNVENAFDDLRQVRWAERAAQRAVDGRIHVTRDSCEFRSSFYSRRHVQSCVASCLPPSDGLRRDDLHVRPPFAVKSAVK